MQSKNWIVLVISVLAASSIAIPAAAQNLFSAYQGKTMIFKGKGVSSGRTFTLKGKVAACSSGQSGLCLGEFPISNANSALVFKNETVEERIQLSVRGGKLAAQMNYVNPQGGIEGAVPLTIRVRK